MPDYLGRRKYARVDVSLPVTAKSHRKTMFEGKVLNLSEGGAFLVTGEKLIVGTDVILFLTLNLGGRSKSCMAPGRVVWTNNRTQSGAAGCGIAFDTGSTSLRRLVGEYVEFKMKGNVSAMGVAEDPKSLKAPGRGQLRG